MGDKGKGKEVGKIKKQKTTKLGLRPHEQRQQDTLANGIPQPLKGPRS